MQTDTQTSFYLRGRILDIIWTIDLTLTHWWGSYIFISLKIFPAKYDETLCKFLLCTYEDSHNSFWSKILSREHVEYVKVAWAENVNFPDCNFRVLRGIFWGVSLKQKLLKIEKYQGRWPFFLDLSIFRVKKCKKRISHKN